MTADGFLFEKKHNFSETAPLDLICSGSGAGDLRDVAKLVAY